MGKNIKKIKEPVQKEWHLSNEFNEERTEKTEHRKSFK